MGCPCSRPQEKSERNSIPQTNSGVYPNLQAPKPREVPNTSSADARNKVSTKKTENFDKDTARTPHDQRSSGVAARNIEAGKTVVYHDEPSGLIERDLWTQKSQIDVSQRRQVHEQGDGSRKIGQQDGRFPKQRGGFSKEEQTLEQGTVQNSDRVDSERSTQRRPLYPNTSEAVEQELSNGTISGQNPIGKILERGSLKEILNKSNHRITAGTVIDVRDKTPIVQPKPVAYDATQTLAADTYADQWDDFHVQMPCSSMYIAKNQQPMWPAICDALRALKKKCEERSSAFNDLKEIIQTYGDCRNNMPQLEKLLNQVYTDAERSTFLHQTLLKMCDLVLNLRSMFTGPPSLLRIGSNQTVSLSQEQAASLLACAFFCLFPYRSETSKQRSFERFPHPNFDRIYQGDSAEKMEKLKCLLHYFERVCKTMSIGQIDFKRFQLLEDQRPSWNTSSKSLCRIDLRSNSRIEDLENYLQVDFANKYIGGGVLGNGCVQEEIRFTICPEMIVSLLLCEVMEPDECIFLIGCERYSTYTGYAKSFQFAGDFQDQTARDSTGHRCCHVVAMDAFFFRDKIKQYQKEFIDRELLKAYTSFYPYGNDAGYRFPIATGSWGCGAFNGDKQMKAIIQLMAASETQRTLLYASFHDKSLVESFSEVYGYLQKEGATVGNLYQYLHHYSKLYNQMTLFQYILRTPVACLQT